MENPKYDYSRLRGRIVEKYGSMSHFADSVGMTRVSVSNRITGKIMFTVEDVDKWATLLDIDVTDLHRYFFAKNVSAEKQPETFETTE